MIDLGIRLLFLNYDSDKSSYQKELKTATDETTKVDLKKKIEKLDQLQLEVIQQYIEEVGLDLPLEMEVYFTGECIAYVDEHAIIGEA
tara:strand:+ start:418 stop:681 length:264 start_codon:yes stop_codon:yes gene_type:complete